MAADLRLIADAAERNADIVSAERFRDRFRDRGLADTGRADETDDLAGQLRLHDADTHGFEDALLDALQSVVVAVELRGCLADIELFLRGHAPRQGKDGIQIIVDHECFL